MARSTPELRKPDPALPPRQPAPRAPRRGARDHPPADGVDGLTLREIGARRGRFAHCPLPALRRQALAARRRRDARGFARCGNGSSRHGRSGRDRAAFEAMGVAYVGFAVANPAHYRVMFGVRFATAESAKAIDCDLTAEADGAFQALVDALAALQRDAIVRDEDTLTMARFVWSVVHGVAMLAIDGQLREPGAVEAIDALRYRASAHRHRRRGVRASAAAPLT